LVQQQFTHLAGRFEFGACWRNSRISLASSARISHRHIDTTDVTGKPYNTHYTQLVQSVVDRCRGLGFENHEKVNLQLTQKELIICKGKVAL